MVEHTAWALPVLKEAYAKREQISRGAKWLYRNVFGKNKRIAFTGHAGVGKTVLFDHLTYKAYKRGYTPPNESQAAESGEIVVPEKGIRLVTIPGQNSSPRLDALDELLRKRNEVDGIIHVVANGFVDVRSAVARQVLIQEKKIDTLQKFREVQLKAELEDLAATCHFVAQAARKPRHPKWLLVAVAKIDLYYDKLPEAQAYYSPEGISEFSGLLNELRLDLGRNNFRWTAAPVCCWLDDFLWHDERAVSSLRPIDRDHYVAKMTQTLEELC